ncbi:MAG TPA: DsbA family protein [Stellaceae bacterium]|nr:DsbA family protein [Stellaceae bacterium]
MTLRLPLVLVAALSIGAAALPSHADPLTPAERAAIEQLIRDTIANHPEIVVDALRDAQKKEDAEAQKKVRQEIVAKENVLLHDPTTPEGGNPHGDVTIVEFFDYRCPYCKEVEPSLEAFLKEDRNLRIVYKEFPILGPSSVYAAHVALAARAQGKYDQFHHAMMAVKGSIDDDVVRKTAESVGIDMSKLASAVDGPAVDSIIKGNFALADALQIDGTPAFIVGDTLLPGVVDIDTLRKVVADARKGG